MHLFIIHLFKNVWKPLCVRPGKHTSAHASFPHTSSGLGHMVLGFVSLLYSEERYWNLLCETHH